MAGRQMKRREAGFRGVSPYVEWPPAPKRARRKKLESATCPHCAREFELPPFRPGLHHSQEACDKARELTRGALQESFLALFLDARNRVQGSKKICRGSAASCVVHPRDVFREAIANNAVGVIVAHNHPSGCPAPSPEDETLTERLVEVGKMLGVPVLDSLVACETGCYSFRDVGKVKF